MLVLFLLTIATCLLQRRASRAQHLVHVALPAASAAKHPRSTHIQLWSPENERLDDAKEGVSVAAPSSRKGR